MAKTSLCIVRTGDKSSLRGFGLVVMVTQWFAVGCPTPSILKSRHESMFSELSKEGDRESIFGVKSRMFPESQYLHPAYLLTALDKITT
jgi:hypothetical protein